MANATVRSRLFVLLLALICSGGNPAAANKKTFKPDVGSITVRGISVNSRIIRNFHRDGAARPIVGKLRWRGGLVLSSQDSAFGGYSGLTVSADGKSLMAVSDAGTWLAARLKYKDGRLEGVDKARVGPLLALKNRRLSRRRDRDAEAIRLLNGNLTNGIALVSFEINQRIGLFKIGSGRLAGPVRYLRPRVRLPRNKGLESVAIFGRKKKRRDVIAFAERSLDGNGHHRGWIWKNLKGPARPVALRNLDGFDITDAVGLENGDLLVLERRFRWSEGVKMRVRHIKAGRLRPGAVLNGLTLLRADMRYEIDNMEGLAVHKTANGKTVLTLISDNNFNSFLQRTILLQFELL
ncbi:MAG: esterase-like activity of phytase family protein [Pseudomonadota bacterium]